MNRREIVLAALALAGSDGYTPVQIQKLLFLVDKRISTAIGGPYFNFRPYDYGPFDQRVYQEIEQLSREGLAEVAYSPATRLRRYAVTQPGAILGQAALDGVDPRVRAYLKALSDWVLSLPFSSLVSSIYAEYPEMKANSVFNQ